MGVLRWVSITLLMIGSMCCQAGELVRFPTLPGANDPNEAYVLAMLRLGLAKSGKAYEVVAGANPMLQGRAILDASSPTGKIDVLWSMTTNERESKLLPIPIPIDKGLLGWRIPLLRADHANLLADVTGLADLSHLKAGQGHDWPDTEILRSNGLTVQTSSDYETLFSMLSVGRFDYFPRSIMEIWNDIANHPTAGFVVDDHIAIHYPAAAYFFVSPRRPQLAKDLQSGLERAIADGSFETLYQARLGPFIKRSHLGQRHVIELANPLLKMSSIPLNARGQLFQP
ncbi:transporter substrate-binding domain-containing protein [Leeia oryzae]|uniref:transporter substrate-binding domain-containing protein n=1 Tax=Leeia oryzae TaxID=356662 RepID=UPI000378E81C|nr:transporter substrate-binding domain-containing protein [Leeia oryzae]